MKIAYIAHPISGDISGNLERIKKIARRINLEEPDVVPFAPYFLDCQALDDDIPEERKRGIKNDTAILKKCIIDEMRLYGDRISPGMSHEVELAHDFGIEVIPMTEAIKEEYYTGEVKNKCKSCEGTFTTTDLPWKCPYCSSPDLIQRFNPHSVKSEKAKGKSELPS